MKYLLKVHEGRGLYFFPDNPKKFVVARVEDNNGIGHTVKEWWQGIYFSTLDDALEELNNKRY